MTDENLKEPIIEVSLNCALNNETVPKVLEWMKTVEWPREGTIVVDLKRIEHFTTAGLASLIMLYKLTNSDIVLMNLSRKTKSLFDVMRIDEGLFKWINVRSCREGTPLCGHSHITRIQYTPS